MAEQSLPLIFSVVVLIGACIVLWSAYCDARAQFGPLGPVSWRYHVRHRWWQTPVVESWLLVVVVYVFLVGFLAAVP